MSSIGEVVVGRGEKENEGEGGNWVIEHTPTKRNKEGNPWGKGAKCLFLYLRPSLLSQWSLFTGYSRKNTFFKTNLLQPNSLQILG